MDNNMIQRFIQFRENFKGDARAEVMRMMQSGQISQDQLNQVQAMAKELQQLVGRPHF